MTDQSRPTTSALRLMARFLRILLPIFVIASIVGLWIVSQQSFGDDRNVVSARVGNVAARMATVLNRLPNASQTVQIESILAVALADPAVTCAVVLDANKKILASAPTRVGCMGAEQDALVEVPLSNAAGQVLCIKYNLHELEERSAIVRAFTLGALFISLLVAAMAAGVSFRITVGVPVRNLLNAIRTTRNSGKPFRVQQVPDDELGQVISAFNDLQEDVAEKTASLSNALRRLDYLYNEMPALMFTLNEKAEIETISGHWTEAIGYRRECVSGKPLGNFIKGLEGQDLAQALLTAEAQLRDMPALLSSADGRHIEVLLSMVKHDVDGKATRLCVLSDVSSLRAAQAELQRQASTDHLTGLPNRKALSERLMNIRKRVSETGARATVLFIDLDDFKAVNDKLGHEAGDELLIAASKRLRNCLAKEDFVARLGGDEFAVVLTEDPSVEGASAVAARVIENISRPYRLGKQIAVIGASVGVASYDELSGGTDDVLSLADFAMYRAKMEGKNRFVVYQPDLPRAA